MLVRKSSSTLGHAREKLDLRTGSCWWEMTSILQFAADQELLSQVHVHEWSSRDEAIRIQRDAAGLLILEPWSSVGTRLAVFGELFDYMARRRNIIGLVGPGSTADIIRNDDLGVVASGEAPWQVADALKSLINRVRQMPSLPPPAEEFSERNTMSRFAQVLEGVLTS